MTRPDVLCSPWKRIADLQRRVDGMDANRAELVRVIYDLSATVQRLETQLAAARQQGVLSRELFR